MELRFALRSLRNNAGFTLLAVVVLALGIGANTAIFSVVNGVLLRPLDYRDPDRIVAVGNAWRDSKVSMGQFSEPDFDDLHAQNTVFDGLACYIGGSGGDAVIVGKSAEFSAVVRVSPDFFHVMRVDAAVGRLLSAEEQRQGGPLAAVVSDGFWKRHFGGNPAAIGGTLRAYDKAFTIVGVLPAGFGFPGKTDVWVSRSIFEANPHRSAHNFRAIARLKPGVSLEQAQAQLTTISARLEEQYPRSNQGKSFRAVRVRDQMVSGVRTTLYLLLGAVALVLLIACANVANLLLARATSRAREMAVRAALSASRWRIVRQLIVESALIAILAGTAGLGVASWGVDALMALSAANLPRSADVHMNAAVLGFTLLLSLLASLVFGLAPAVQAARVDLNEALKQGATRATVGGAAGRMRAALVVAEVAISVVLLVGAGLLLRSFAALTRVDLGFRPERVLVMHADMSASTLEQSQRATATYGELVRQAETIPGILGAAGIFGLPGGPGRSNGGYAVEGGPGYEQLGMSMPQADFFVNTPGYFQVLGIPLRAGRDFSERDRFDAPFSAIVSESLVRQSFPNENPLGRRIQCGLDSPNFMTIVGITADIRASDPGTPPRPAIYMPYLQHPYYGRAMSFVMKTQSDPLALAEPLRRKAREVNPEIPVKFTTMEARLAETVAPPRFRGILLGIFAALAVCLAMAGVYGVMAYMVTQRAAEIGLRMALGAHGGSIVKLVLARGLALAGAGLALGFAGSIAATRLLQTMLYGVEATDPATYAVMAAVVAAVALLACALPAWRAARVDPLVALRQE